MITKSVNLLVLPMLLFLAGCSRNFSYQEAMTKNRQKIENTEKVADAEFLVEAKSLNILQTRLNREASNAGYAATVISMAKNHLEDHQGLSKELTKLAKNEDIVLPAAMSEKHKKEFDDLTRTSREDFDRNFVRVIKKINEENIYNFSNKASSAYDADVRAFAARKLDILRLHSKRIEEVEKELLRTY